MFTDPQRHFGINGTKWVDSTNPKACSNNLQAKETVDSYLEIARRFENGDADDARIPGETRISKSVAEVTFFQDVPQQSCFEALQRRLLESIRKKDQLSTLYQPCLITLSCSNFTRIPKTAVVFSAVNDWPVGLSILLELHASPNDVDEAVRRAMDYCAELGYDTCEKILVEHGASLRTTVSRGSHGHLSWRRPLHAAVSNGRTGMVKLLLNTGTVDPNDIDNQGRTPLEGCFGSWEWWDSRNFGVVDRQRGQCRGKEQRRRDRVVQGATWHEGGRHEVVD